VTLDQPDLKEILDPLGQILQ